MAPVFDLTPISKNPLVSLIMPSRNQGKYLDDAILSVLKQSYKNIELIVVDAASTDDTISILKKYEKLDRRLRWISEPDKGGHEATNKGFRMAKGEIVAIASTSDPRLQGCVEGAVKEFVGDPLLTFVGGSTVGTHVDGSPNGKAWRIGPRRYYSTDEVLNYSDWPSICAVYMRRDLIMRIGGIDESLPTCHTYFFLHYLLETARIGGRALVVPEFWAIYREHPGANNRRPEMKGWPSIRERHAACRLNANRYSDILSPSQRRKLKRVPYYYEITSRFFIYRHIFRLLSPTLRAVGLGATKVELSRVFSEIGRSLKKSAEKKILRKTPRSHSQVAGNISDTTWYRGSQVHI